MFQAKSLLLPSVSPFPLSPTHYKTFVLSPLNFSASLSSRPISVYSPPRTEPRLTHVAEPIATIATAEQEEGPVELPPSSPSIFATSDDPSPLQVATSVLLTGAISIFLFRSVRRRAKRAKELKFRSSGAKRTLKDEALDSLKVMSSGSIEAKSTPSPAQAFLGAIAAGVIALILYKFTTTIEASLNRQTISDNFSVRQLTVTIRTIINGICYLATFVFGINSLGLFLYSGQLAFNSFMEEEDGSTKNQTEMKSGGSEINSGGEPLGSELSDQKGDQNSNDEL